MKLILEHIYNEYMPCICENEIDSITRDIISFEYQSIEDAIKDFEKCVKDAINSPKLTPIFYFKDSIYLHKENFEENLISWTIYTLEDFWETYKKN